SFTCWWKVRSPPHSFTASRGPPNMRVKQPRDCLLAGCLTLIRREKNRGNPPVQRIIGSGDRLWGEVFGSLEVLVRKGLHLVFLLRCVSLCVSRVKKS